MSRMEKDEVFQKESSDKEKRAVQGKRTKNDETIHKYVEEFFEKFDTVMRSLSEVKG
mgnify:CR=1 FL=1